MIHSRATLSALRARSALLDQPVEIAALLANIPEAEPGNSVPGVRLEDRLLALALRALALPIMDKPELFAEGLTGTNADDRWRAAQPPRQGIALGKGKGHLGIRNSAILTGVIPTAASHRSMALLTQRENEVVTRIACGLSNRQIAEDLVISRSTAERHVANILNKLDMNSRAQVAVWAVQNRRTQTR